MLLNRTKRTVLEAKEGSLGLGRLKHRWVLLGSFSRRQFHCHSKLPILAMETSASPEHNLMIDGSASPTLQIDPRRARFPCCIVWTPLPVISWLIPFIGHIGICREDGVILDFAGPNFVCVDNFSFGAATRYIQISKEKCHSIPNPSVCQSEDQYGRMNPEET
ncbi:hypothetical protein Pyn_40224 [Prunus yedoensis var. nudiflora]|uniref:Protein REVERSION-TO-ETHYLENE SENSITIVITY1 n=1 Tax=Prunus yedoensis var. nudiflora TaxID=2094558 RepID=A0A314UHY9_PRUYE|nr:hypothetical protein Pyn_40224 [Prunus yedoensis var. nudiflora]